MTFDQHVRAARRRLFGEAGFTLAELLVVVLLIGILAAIALPLFLDQQNKARDADAKANARNLASEVETCFVPNEDFRDCDGAGVGDGLEAPSLTLGGGPGEVEVTNAGELWFEIRAVSQSSSGGAYHTFSLRRALDGTFDRTCTAGPGNNQGGCKGGSW